MESKLFILENKLENLQCHGATFISKSTTNEATDYFTIDLVNYPKGIYLLTTEQDGILLNTERLIIQ